MKKKKILTINPMVKTKMNLILLIRKICMIYRFDLTYSIILPVIQTTG